MAGQNINKIVHHDRHGNVVEERRFSLPVTSSEGSGETVVMTQKGVTDIVQRLRGDISQIGMAAEIAYKEKLDNNNGKASVMLYGDLSFAEQVVTENTIYIVRHDFDLQGEVFVVPDDCVLIFEGGSLCNGTLRGRNMAIYDGDIRNVSIVPSEHIKVSNTDFHINNRVIVVDLSGHMKGEETEDDGTSAIIDGCRFFCEDADYIIEYNNSNLCLVNITISNCIFKGSTKAYHRERDDYGGIKKGYAIHVQSVGDNENIAVHLLHNDIDLEVGAPYFINKVYYAEVVGGTYTSKETGTACNLYSCNKGVIRGGYYHDMQRGATLGGREGCHGYITGTINENMTFSGISVDYAVGTREVDGEGHIITPETYADRRVVVSENVIINCRYGMYLQIDNGVIANNNIKGGPNSIPNPKATFGIRVNNQTPGNDENIIICNNILDFKGMDVYPIYLAANTKAILFNNSCYSDKGIGGESASQIKESTGTLVVEDKGEGQVERITQDINYIYVKERENKVELKFVTTYKYEWLRQPVLIVNASPNSTVELTTTVSRAVWGDMYVYPLSCALVVKIAPDRFIVEHFGYYGTSSAYNRGKRRYPIGYCFYDTTKNKPMWLRDGRGLEEDYWVYADGTRVESDVSPAPDPEDPENPDPGPDHDEEDEEIIDDTTTDGNTEELNQ